MDLGIAGKRAAVAAASSGPALASAAALAAEGATVAICGRDEKRLEAAAVTVGHGCPALRSWIQSDYPRRHTLTVGATNTNLR